MSREILQKQPPTGLETLSTYVRYCSSDDLLGALQNIPADVLMKLRLRSAEEEGTSKVDIVKNARTPQSWFAR